MIEHITTHKEKAASYLLQQYKESYNITKLVDVFIGRIQQLENQAQLFHQKRRLNTAEGKTLDNIGAIVGETRQWRNDEEFRSAIFGRIMFNRGGGTPEDLINAIKLIYQPMSITYKESEPLYFSVFLQASSVLQNIHKLIRRIKPLCIQDYVITYSDEEFPLTLSEVASEGAPFVVSDTLTNKSVYNTGDEDFEVEASVVKNSTEQIGLAEIILTTTNLKITGGTYQVDDKEKLDVLPYEVNTLDGFKITQGNKLSEVVNYGR